MKKYIKFLSLICALVLSFSFLAVVGVAGGTGTEADPFIITTAEELQNINNNVTAHYILGNNIDLADMDFTPIGNADSGAFSGSFNGNGYKISNLNVFSGKYAGLFGSNEGVIKNVILDNIYVYGTRYVGGVVGQNTNCGTVENCSVLSGLVESDGGINALNIGGICGINEGAFSGSFSNGADVSTNVSGINVYTGGIMGCSGNSLTIANAHNTGDISSSSSSFSHVGGIIGYGYDSLSIRNSINNGIMSSDGTGKHYVGGIVGKANDTVNIDNCCNLGKIDLTTSSYYMYGGGIIGYANGAATITRCSNSACIVNGAGILGYSYKCDITNCYNSGNYGYTFGYSASPAISTLYYYFAGGIIGYTDSGCVTNCYNTGECMSLYTSKTHSREDDAGGICGEVGRAGVSLNISYCYSLKETIKWKARYTGYNGTLLSSSDMKEQSSYNGWNFDEIWSIGGSINSGYPIIKSNSSPLSLNNSNKTMLAGETLQLIAYKNGVASSDITWSVSNGNSTVSSNGLVMAATGLSTITATDSAGNKANFNMYGYTAARSLSATDRTISLSSSFYSNESFFEINGSDTDFILDYQSSDTSVVKLTSIGSLIPVSVGTATITATTYGGVSATQTVTVTDEAESISLPSTLTVARGATKTLTATTSPDPTSSVITWESSDSSVATVDSEGNVTGLKSGTTIITATTDNGYSDTCTVTVNAPITEMAFETPSLTLYVGQEYKLKLNISPTDTTDKITYSTSSSTYASVTSAGTVTAKKAGTATITAKSSSGLKAYCNITIKSWPSVFTLVDSTATITENIITTDTTGVRNLEKLVTVKDGYNIEVSYSCQTNVLNYCGTGTTIDVYDDYGNFVITYTLVVNGDVNGDSFCDVIDASLTEKYSTDAATPTLIQAYAANGSATEIVDVTSYQYVVNKALDD